MKENKNKVVIQIAKISILAIGITIGCLSFGGNFPRIGLAHAATSKEAIVQSARTQIPQQSKLYLKSAPVNVVFEGSRWVASKNEVLNWIKVNDGNVSVDCSGFVNSIANQVNIAPTSDRDGRSVDNSSLTNQIQEALNSGRPNRTITLPITTIPRNSRAGLYNGRYIDINLSEQKLYAFEYTNLVNQFLVSTGRPGYDTPTGEYHVYGKDRSARMHGPGYYLPNVPYISWFSGDYSVHGTYWHNNFGHVMSHGCVNMDTNDAEWIYNWDEIGTPIYIHY